MNQTEAAASSLGIPVASRGIGRPDGVRASVNWIYLASFTLFHLALPLAFVPWFFSWTGLALIPLGNYLFCSLGIGLCYHRTLTHRGLVLPKRLEHFLAILGVCSLQDTPLKWVTTHRMHHQFSDQQPDPHSPMAGFFWGHMGWAVLENSSLDGREAYQKFSPDLLKDPFYKRLERRHRWLKIWAIHVGLFFLAGLVFDWIRTGTFAGGVQFGASLVLWGVVFRTLYTWHVTWAVNSLAHIWGYRSHQTPDNSRNNWLVALATNGEGWHNNHHADQRCAAHGRRWWELDVTYLTIRVLEYFGVASKVRRPN